MTLSFASIGDSLHAVNVVNTLAFAVAVVKYHEKLDSTWAKNGFCVVNEDVPFRNSHDWCFYLDVCLAVICGLTYLALRNKPGMSSANDLVKFSIPGILGHGIGHYFLAKAIRDGHSASGYLPYEALQQMSWSEVIMFQMPFFVFWVSLLKSACTNIGLKTIVAMSVLAMTCSTVVPSLLQFTYVQTVLLICFSINQACRPEKDKDFEYVLFVALTAIPVTFVGWLEATSCSTTLVQNLYGHVMYDVCIPVSLLAFYFLCYFRQIKLRAMITTKKKL